MKAKPNSPMKPIHEESLKDVHFPRAGVDTGEAFSKQPNRPLLDKSDYARTSIYAKNVRGYDPISGRARGGTRSGLVRYINQQPIGEEYIIQDLNTVVTTGTPMQQSLSGRLVTLVAVVEGKVYYADAGETVWTKADNQTGEEPELNITGIVRSASNQQLLWFADGVNWCYFSPATRKVEIWAATAGLLPEDEDENTPRLICTWRGRTVLSGLLNDPQNWFMSAVDVPTDFDYAPLSPSPADAVAGNNGPAGLVGDCITGLIPYTDDVLIFLCDHQIWLMRGDPLNGGQLDMVSGVIGGAFGEAWCLDPFGNVFFFSNRMGIYRMVPGSQPERISYAIDSFISDIDSGNNSIRLLWDDRFQGFHTFITPLDGPDHTSHLFWESRTGAWFIDEFASSDFDPLCCCTFDGNLPNDRVSLIGSWDGYVRSVSPTATLDDWKKIESEVWIGPFLTPNLDAVIMKDLQAILGDESGEVRFDIYLGDTAETAFHSEPVFTGTWKSGRNYTNLIRKSGHALYIRLRSSDPWSMESIRVRLAETGKVRMREK